MTVRNFRRAEWFLNSGNDRKVSVFLNSIEGGLYKNQLAPANGATKEQTHSLPRWSYVLEKRLKSFWNGNLAVYVGFPVWQVYRAKERHLNYAIVNFMPTMATAEEPSQNIETYPLLLLSPGATLPYFSILLLRLLLATPHIPILGHYYRNIWCSSYEIRMPCVLSRPTESRDGVVSLRFSL